MPHNRGTRRKPKYVGLVSYKGHTKWVGSYATVKEYKRAREERRGELRAEVDASAQPKIPTVLEFAGATIDKETSRITMIWPAGERTRKENGRKTSSVQWMHEALRPFIREFSDRPMDSFGRDEALTWIRPRGAQTRQTVRQFFNHALDRELIQTNPFAKTGASKRKRRVDRHDFEIVTNDQYERLRKCARASRADNYGLVIEGAVLAVGEAAIHPGELFALHHDEIDYTENVLHIRWQLDSSTGKRVSPKDDNPRWVIMSPTFCSHLEHMPRYSDTIVFPAVRGGYMTQSNWTHYWHAVRASAGMPAQEFYELKHRAIQWMIDPVNDGGLGLDPQTVATMVGHDGGGYLIYTVYTKLSEHRARARAKPQWTPTRSASPTPQTRCPEIARSVPASRNRLAADLRSARNGSAADRPLKNHASTPTAPQKPAICEVLDHKPRDRDSLWNL
jgi:integrase